MESIPPTPEAQSIESPAPTMSLAGRLLNVFAAPSDVFGEIKAASPRVANWLVPVLIWVVVGVISCFVIFAQPSIRQAMHEKQVKVLDQQVQQGKMTQTQEDQALQMMEKFMGPTMLAIFGSFAFVILSFGSVFGWALVLWLAGRWLFKAQFGYLKVVEVAGLSSVILTLGVVISTLLGVILGRLYTGPSVALLVNDFDPTNRGHLLLGALNVIYLWHAGVLAIGLAKLSGALGAKAAAAVFGFWVLMELLLIAVGLGQWAL